MSKDYSIEIKLEAKFNKDNMTTILEKGSQKGFKYYDHIMGIRYKNSPLLDAQGATLKIIKAHETKPEDGPCVYTILDEATDTSAYLCFYQSDDGYLEFYMGTFGCPKKKGYFIDFAYYIRLCLDLCEDFPVLELKTTMI